MMMAWNIFVPLCSFGFLKEFRPSESFVTQYLVGPDKNFTRSQVYQEIYPIGTYSNMSLLILVFLLTDWARYKPVVILEGLAGAATYCLIIWGQGIPLIQVAEIFYGLFMATEVAYLTYIYAVCKKKDFQRASGFVRSGILLGRFVSGVVSQLTVSLHILTYHQLNFLTLTGVCLSVVAAVCLPSVKKSTYFHRETVAHTETIAASENSDDSQQNQDQELNMQQASNLVVVPLDRQCSQSNVDHGNIIHVEKPTSTVMSAALKAMANDFCSSYRNRHVLKWSLWWALATCGYLQVTSYIQLLWQASKEEDQELYNGVVDAVYTLLGSISSWYVGQHKMNLAKQTYLILTVCCLLQGTFLLISAGVIHLWTQYVLYILFKILYHSTMVLASSEVAASLKAESHALIFGFNMFVALCLQSIFTLVVAAKGGLGLGIENQFFVYGSYFVVLGVGFTVSVCMPGVYKLISLNKITNKKMQPSECA